MRISDGVLLLVALGVGACGGGAPPPPASVTADAPLDPRCAALASERAAIYGDRAWDWVPAGGGDAWLPVQPHEAERVRTHGDLAKVGERLVWLDLRQPKTVSSWNVRTHLARVNAPLTVTVSLETLHDPATMETVKRLSESYPLGLQVEGHYRLLPAERWAPLADLTELRMLDLSGYVTPAAALVHIQGLSQLRVLLLNHTFVGDEGAAYLHSLTSLRVMEVRNTRISRAAARLLLDALPQLCLSPPFDSSS